MHRVLIACATYSAAVLTRMRVDFRIHTLSSSALATELTLHDEVKLVSAIHAAHEALLPGEEATEPLEPLQAVVSTCRSHGYWLFLDLNVAGERIQAVAQPIRRPILLGPRPAHTSHRTRL